MSKEENQNLTMDSYSSLKKQKKRQKKRGEPQIEKKNEKNEGKRKERDELSISNSVVNPQNGTGNPQLSFHLIGPSVSSNPKKRRRKEDSVSGFKDLGPLNGLAKENGAQARREEDSVSRFKDLPNDEDGGDNGKDSEEDDKDNLKGLGQFNEFVKENVKPAKPEVSNEDIESFLTQTRFDQCPVSPLSLEGIKDAGYEKMTIVQEATLPVILQGKDVLARARTGTGKTLAFLLPAVEAIVNSSSIDRNQTHKVNVLVLCPTRELVHQTVGAAKTLLKYHPSIGVQFVIGGTSLSGEKKRVKENLCQILVATPGRLVDHIENTWEFATLLKGVKVLVLDEADHLLGMGFRKEIDKIIDSVPKQRQTLLFSATIPEEVRQICNIALNEDHKFINTVEEGSEDTHTQVRQTYLLAPLEKQFSLIYTLLINHIAEDVDYKALVFCTTAMITKFVASLLSKLNLNVLEMHSRKSQNYRTRISKEFRKSKGVILVTSDVSARGVDYPDVTFVIQVGLPSGRDQYIHRLGRTGRKGKQGQGLLLLAPWEDFFLSTLRDLPITEASDPSVLPDTNKKVKEALAKVEMIDKEKAYQSWLGYYKSDKVMRRNLSRLVQLANEFSRSLGLDTPPAISKKVIGKMGLLRVPGIRSKI